MADIDKLKKEAAVIRDEVNENANTAQRVGNLLIQMADALGSSAATGNLTGYIAVDSLDQLPSSPSGIYKTVGYLFDGNLYVFVGKNGDTAGGLYKNCGPFKGPKGDVGPALKFADLTPDEKKELQGEPGKPGPKGDQGNTGSSIDYPFELVNNLEQGGADKALTAEQGKNIGEEIFGITGGTVTPDYHLKKGYISIDGNISPSSSGYQYTSPISVSAGDVIEITPKGYGFSAISEVISEGLTYKPLYNVEKEQQNILKKYEVPKEMMVSICDKIGPEASEIPFKIYKNEKEGLKQGVKRIDQKLVDLSDTLKSHSEILTPPSFREITPVLQQGSINLDGIKNSSNAKYQVSEPIFLKKNSSIKLVVSYSEATCLAITDKEGISYSPIYKSNSEVLNGEYTYIASEDTYIAVSGRKGTLFIWYSDTFYNAVESNSEKIKILESSLYLPNYQKITPKLQSGYIDTKGRAVQSSLYERTYPIKIAQGGGIRYEVFAATTATLALVEKPNQYRVLQTSPQSSFPVRVVGEYVALKDESVVISGRVGSIKIEMFNNYLAKTKTDQVEEELEDIYQEVYPNAARIGNINPNDGAFVDTNTRCVLYFNDILNGVFSFPTNLKASRRYKGFENINKYDTDWHTGGFLKCEPINSPRLCVSKLDDSIFTDEEVRSIVKSVKIIKGKLVTFNGKDNPIIGKDRELLPAVNESFVLKCANEANWNDGTTNNAHRYIWHDSLLNFYYSNTIYGDKHFLFKWNLPSAPKNYTVGVLTNGDLLCLFRTEIYISGSNDSCRRNPYIIKADEGYKSHEIDFGTSLKPSAWLQNCGFCRVDEQKMLMISEYARPSVERACVWKIVGDPADPKNWKIVLEKMLSGDMNIGFKHFHAVQYDPFTGIIYAASGDDDSAAAIYVSSDNGESFSLLRGPNEKECRLLNFIFTKDYIYWASDSGLPNKHFLFRVARNAETQVMDFATFEELYKFPTVPGGGGVATYASVYFQNLNCILFLDRSDGSNCNTIVMRVWDIALNKMYDVDKISRLDEGGNMGFRNEYVQLYPRGNEMVCGFGYEKFGVSDNRNRNKLLGNTDASGIRNIVIHLERCSPEGFRISYNTSK